jgi:hypothetical protein
MKTPAVVEALKEAATGVGITVRMERGSFRGGRCSVDGVDVIVLNKLHVPELQLTVLAESLSPAEIEGVFLKPAVRRALEDTWRRIGHSADHEVERDAG